MIDWRLLQTPLIVLLISASISGMVWTWANAYNETQMGGKSKLERDFTSTKQRYNEAKRDRALYKEYLDSFLQYKNKGIIGEEQRLSWIEELEVINRELKLAVLRYEISPQTQVDLVGLKLPNSVNINASNMKLTASLLHEGDVIKLLDELKNRARGLFAIKQCKLQSKIGLKQEFRYRPKASYVNMECDLEWYTVEVGS